MRYGTSRGSAKRQVSIRFQGTVKTQTKYLLKRKGKRNEISNNDLNDDIYSAR